MKIVNNGGFIAGGGGGGGQGGVRYNNFFNIGGKQIMNAAHVDRFISAAGPSQGIRNVQKSLLRRTRRGTRNVDVALEVRGGGGGGGGAGFRKIQLIL